MLLCKSIKSTNSRIFPWCVLTLSLSLPPPFPTLLLCNLQYLGETVYFPASLNKSNKHSF